MAGLYTTLCAAFNLSGVTDKSVLGYPLWLVVTVGLLALCVVVVLVAIITNELSKGLSHKKSSEEEEEGELSEVEEAEEQPQAQTLSEENTGDAAKDKEPLDNSKDKPASVVSIAAANDKAIREDNSLFNAELAKVDNKADDTKPTVGEQQPQQDNKKQDESAQDSGYARRAKHAATSRKRKEMKVALDGYLPYIKDEPVPLATVRAYEGGGYFSGGGRKEKPLATYSLYSDELTEKVRSVHEGQARPAAPVAPGPRVRSEDAAMPAPRAAAATPAVDPIYDGEPELIDNSEEYERMRLETRYDRSFNAKLIQSDDETQRRYGSLRNRLLAYKGVKSRVSWGGDTFKLGRRTIAKIGINGKSLLLYLAIDPASCQGTKYRVDDVSAYSKYAEVPCRYKVAGDRKLMYARELIDILLDDEAFGEESDVIIMQPYQSDEELIRLGLIKIVPVSGN
ncbi:MAG: hypothetical protein K2M44_07520 [Clostridia bacterium]|nr:hypothetical protein [Clostridia bacterium]